MSSRRPAAGHTRRRSQKRKFDIFRKSSTFTGATTGVAEIDPILSSFVTSYGAMPFQATLSIPRFDIMTVGTGTGTGANSVTVGWLVGAGTLDAADLDPVANPDQFWWVRKFYLQNNSNPVGVPWAVQGIDMGNMRVGTKRTLKTLGDQLFLAVRPDFTGFTAVQTTINAQYGILYA